MLADRLVEKHVEKQVYWLRDGQEDRQVVLKEFLQVNRYSSYRSKGCFRAEGR